MSENFDEQIASSLFSLGQIFREKMRDPKLMSTLSFSKIETLRFIFKNKTTSMKDIAKYLHITPPSATALIDSLKKENFIKRITNKTDRRITMLKLTTKGEKLLVEKHKKMSELVKKGLNKLKEEEKEQFINILNKFLSA